MLVLLFGGALPAAGQFVEGFEGPALDGWTTLTGDGEARMTMEASGGYARVTVDATDDRRNLWWALVKHDVSADLDLARLQEPRHELRIAARVRTSHAPRRVNLHLNTQRTTDFHSHLLEFDLPETGVWHWISMTTRGFDARPGDRVNAQLALMDWGHAVYHVDIDSFRVEVVDTARAEPDRGEAVVYHPPLPDVSGYAHHVPVSEDAVIDVLFPDVNYRGWQTLEEGRPAPVLLVDGPRRTILRWDLSAFAGRRVTGFGVLELTTESVQRTEADLPEFGVLRISEIFGGAAHWTRETVTWNALLDGAPVDDVFNPQMVIDVAPAEMGGGVTRAAISRPVLQRLIDGTTRGLVLQAQGALSAAFYAAASGHDPATLHFTTEAP